MENVSQNIKPFFENVSEAQLQSAVCGSILGYYILCVGNKAIIMDCESENDYSYWYILEFPPQIRIIGIDPNNNLFLCVNDCNVCFTAQFDGNTDNIIVGNLNKKEVASIEIEAFSIFILSSIKLIASSRYLALLVIPFLPSWMYLTSLWISLYKPPRYLTI